MYLARIVGASKPQVYPLIGVLYFPRAWRFMSYQRGAAAIAETKVEAVVMAEQEFCRAATTYLLQRIASNHKREIGYVGGGNIDNYFDSKGAVYGGK